MSLIKCTECGKEISAEGIACPHCGAPLPIQPAKKTFTIQAFMAFVFIVIVIAVFSFFILPAFCPRVVDTIEKIELEGREYGASQGINIFNSESNLYWSRSGQAEMENTKDLVGGDKSQHVYVP